MTLKSGSKAKLFGIGRADRQMFHGYNPHAQLGSSCFLLMWHHLKGKKNKLSNGIRVIAKKLYCNQEIIYQTQLSFLEINE